MRVNFLVLLLDCVCVTSRKRRCSMINKRSCRLACASCSRSSFADPLFRRITSRSRPDRVHLNNKRRRATVVLIKPAHPREIFLDRLFFFIAIRYPFASFRRASFPFCVARRDSFSSSEECRTTVDSIMLGNIYCFTIRQQIPLAMHTSSSSFLYKRLVFFAACLPGID